VASTLFAAAHLPSPVLTTATLIGALLFCEMYRRYRSISPLGIVHAMLGLTIAIITPDSCCTTCVWGLDICGTSGLCPSDGQSATLQSLCLAMQFAECSGDNPLL
jgi:Type II CAAX prenyl endopeptidase Rce1-like